MAEERQGSSYGVSIPYVLILTATKLFANAGLRMFFPFAGFLEEDWNVTSGEIAAILGISELGGLLAGFVAPVADATKLGKKNTGIISIALTAATMFAMVAPPIPAVLTTLRFIYLIATNLCYIMIQAITVGLANPSKLGRITGILESSWSLSLFIIFPLLSRAYKDLGWRSPFIIEGIMLSLLTFAFAWVVPQRTQDENEKKKTGCKQQVCDIGKTYLACFKRPAAVCLTFAAFFLVIAHHAIFSAYALFAKDAFQLDPVGIGDHQTVIGASELLGVALVSLLSDRFGIANCLLFGTGVYTVAIICLVFSSLSLNVPLILTNMFFIYMHGEASIVLNIVIAESFVEEPLKTTLIGINFQAMAISRSLATIFAEFVYRSFGFQTVCIIGGSSAFTSFALYYTSLRIKKQTLRVAQKSTESESNSDSTTASSTIELEERRAEELESSDLHSATNNEIVVT